MWKDACQSFSKGVSPWVFHVDACQLSGSGGCQHCPLGSWCRQVLRLRLGYPVANGGFFFAKELWQLWLSIFREFGMGSQLELRIESVSQPHDNLG